MPAATREHERQLTYNPESTWAELWVGEGEEAEALYVDLNWGSGVTAEPPIDGVSSVLSFPSGMSELARYVEEHGYYCDDPVMEARLHGTAIELVVDGKRYHFIKAQLEGVVKLRALEEGSRCEDLEAFLDATTTTTTRARRRTSSTWPSCRARGRSSSRTSTTRARLAPTTST